MNRTTKLVWALFPGLAMATLIGCVEVKQDVKEELPKLLKGPESAPVRTITNFSTALRCMDAMMIDYSVYDVSMLVEDLKDSTGNVKAGAKDMLISAISDMTRRSHAIKLIAFGADSGNLVSFMASANETGAYAVVPSFDIRGSISQLDKDVAGKDASEGFNLGGVLPGGTKAGLGMGSSKTAKASVMALDLAVMKTKDMSVIPGVISKNQIVVFKEGSGSDMDASIGKFGLNFSMNLVRAEGDAQALRNLIELAAIELVGKLTKTPYWNCMGVNPEQEEIKSEIYDWYYNLVADKLVIFYFQQQLRNRGYYSGPLDGQANAPLTEAIKRYQSALGTNVDGNITQSLFADLLNKPTPPAPVALPLAASAAASLNIHFADAGKTSLHRGEPFQIEVQPSQDAYVACYFASEDGSIQRFFPNRFTPDSLVKTSEPLLLPGTAPFKMFASKAGKAERMVCLSAPTPAVQKIPANIRGTDFENLPIHGLEEVENAFRQVVGQDLGGTYFDIKVQ